MKQLATVACVIAMAGWACKKAPEKSEGEVDKPAAAKVKAANSASAAADKPAAKIGDQAAKNVKHIEAQFAAKNARDVDAVLAQFTPDALSDGIGQATPSPPEKVADDRKWLDKLWKLYPNAREDAVLIVADDSRSAFLWHTDTGAGHSFMGATLTKHDSAGRISERRGLMDSLTLFHQWGARPSKEAPDSEPAWETKVRAIASGSDTEAANKELVGRLLEAWSRNDGDAVGAMLAPGFKHRVLSEKRSLDAAGFTAWLKGRQGTVKTDFSEVLTLAAGDWVVREGGITMNFLKGEAAGKKAIFQGVLFAEVKDGKVARTIGVINSAQGQISLGLMTAEEFDAIEAKHLEKLLAGPPAKK